CQVHKRCQSPLAGPNPLQINRLWRRSPTGAGPVGGVVCKDAPPRPDTCPCKGPDPTANPSTYESVVPMVTPPSVPDRNPHPPGRRLLRNRAGQPVGPGRPPDHCHQRAASFTEPVVEGLHHLVLARSIPSGTLPPAHLADAGGGVGDRRRLATG